MLSNKGTTFRSELPMSMWSRFVHRSGPIATSASSSYTLSPSWLIMSTWRLIMRVCGCSRQPWRLDSRRREVLPCRWRQLCTEDTIRVRLIRRRMWLGERIYLCRSWRFLGVVMLRQKGFGFRCSDFAWLVNFSVWENKLLRLICETSVELRAWFVFCFD